MSGNKALRRAMETKEAARVTAELPNITSTIELITPEKALEMLQKNTHNRVINYKRVEEYTYIMKSGGWVLHAQGIILDKDENILTGQKRLWAVVYANIPVYFYVSRNNPVASAKLLDRGDPQTARDLASRDTARRHSPTESSIARAMFVLRGNMKPTVDELGELIHQNSDKADRLLKEIRGEKRTKTVIMLLAAISETTKSVDEALIQVRKLPGYVDRLELTLLPATPDTCWGKGVAFTVAMAQARKIVTEV